MLTANPDVKPESASKTDKATFSPREIVSSVRIAMVGCSTSRPRNTHSVRA